MNISTTCHKCYGREIIDGLLSCSCGKIFPILEAIPVMLLQSNTYMRELQSKYPLQLSIGNACDKKNAGAGFDAYRKTQQRFGFEWMRYPTCFEQEEEKIFYEETQIEAHQFRNRLILDAGCGMGRFTRIAGRSAGEVIGLDFSDSVLKARMVTRSNPCVHIIQADILNLPFRDRQFDIIYSLGVLHHTPDTEKSFAALAKKIKAGGLISIWVYGTAGAYEDFISNPLKANRSRFMKNAFIFRMYWLLVILREKVSTMIRKITVRCPHALLYLFCYFLVLAGKIPLLKYLTFSSHRDWRVRLLENFDWLSPPFQHHHTKEEVLHWFQLAHIDAEKMLEHGFIPRVGVLGARKK